MTRVGTCNLISPSHTFFHCSRQGPAGKFSFREGWMELCQNTQHRWVTVSWKGEIAHRITDTGERNDQMVHCRAVTKILVRQKECNVPCPTADASFHSSAYFYCRNLPFPLQLFGQFMHACMQNKRHARRTVTSLFSMLCPPVTFLEVIAVDKIYPSALTFCFSPCYRQREFRLNSLCLVIMQAFLIQQN